MIILNKDLRGSMVPRYDCLEVSEAGEGAPMSVSPCQRALSDLVRFAGSFDPHQYETETGNGFPDESAIPGLVDRIGGRGESDVDFATLRWAAWILTRRLESSDTDVVTGKLLDRVLDAIHWEASRAERKRNGCGPQEPWIGTQGQAIAVQDQGRFRVTTGESFDRDRMFDFVAGLMLREYGEVHVARSLGLYPPRYHTDESGLVDHIFMIVIEGRDRGVGDEDEQDKFAERTQRSLLAANLGVVPSGD